MEFPTACWFETHYSVYTMRQASRHSWRIGQTDPVQVVFMAYRNTLQADALKLVAQKLQSSLAVEGELPEDGLAAYGDDGDDLMLHGKIVMNLGGELWAFVKPRRLGALLASDSGVWLERDPDTVREPDLAFTAAERLPLDAWNTGYSEVVPDLVVEVASPSDSRRELNDKAQMWLRHGPASELPTRRRVVGAPCRHAPCEAPTGLRREPAPATVRTRTL